MKNPKSKPFNITRVRGSAGTAMSRVIVSIAVLALSIMAISIVATHASGGGDTITNIEASLAGASLNGQIPRGQAEYKVFVSGHRKFETEVFNVNLPSGTVLNVLVDGTRVGGLRIGVLAGELELETEDGQTVPQVNSRTRITVTDPSGNTVVAGSFSNMTPSPSPTPTSSPSPGASPSPSPGSSPSPSPSPSASPSPSPGASPSPSPSPSASPSPSPSPGSGTEGEIRIEARLAGAAIGGLLPKGHAKFRSRTDGRRKLNVEVEKVNLPAGTVLKVLIDNLQVGQIELSASLETEIELDTERGTPIPSITSTSTAVVTDAQGKTILSGVFNTSGRSTAGNDIDDNRYFVEQHYRDFFDREADDNGLDFWERQISYCGTDAACIERARINTSGAFFLSIEFQQTGYLLYRFNKASFGTMPRRNEFLVEMQAIAQGVVVGLAGWEAKLEDNKRAAAERWANRADFKARFDGMTNRQFVNTLFANAGVNPNPQVVEDLINGLNVATETRGTVLRKVAENSEFARRESNPAFVLMQYFGYLHRNPDEGPDHDLSGFNFWLHKLNDHSGNFHSAEMVRAFILASEYRNRFAW